MGAISGDPGPSPGTSSRESAGAPTNSCERLFQTVQATWNLLERSAGAALAEAHAAGCGVIVKEAVPTGAWRDGVTWRRRDLQAGGAEDAGLH
jgi:aryl-alcohol dehydrogenase-like predicted oxidoreductase